MKKNTTLIFAILVCSILSLNSQNIAISDDNTYTADSSAMLDVKSITKGMLVPRMTSVQRTGIVSPATGLLVFDTNENVFYYYTGTAWTNMSTGQLWSKNGNYVYLTNIDENVGIGVTAPDNKLSVKADATTGIDESIFAVLNNNGDTVFAVYQEGVRIWVNDAGGTKANGSRGGFAVGGYSPTKLGITNEYLRVTPDSVRIYIDDSYIPAKANGSRGGFAVGGFNPAKGTPTDNYLFVQDDSTRVYVNDSTAGFGITNIEGGGSSGFMSLTTRNYFIGHLAGSNNTTGDINTFIGYNAGLGNISGSKNIILGYQAGYANLDGFENVFIGNRSGYENSSGYNNTFLGNLCGYSNKVGYNNIFIGNKAGFSNVGGAGEEGSFNTYLGFECGYHGIKAASNTMLGYQSGYLNSDGRHNTYIGRWSGYGNNGSFNVFIGTEAGKSSTAESYRLRINADSSSVPVKPLIYGEFDNRKVVINGEAADNINNRTFFVRGDAGGLFSWFVDSDKRLKKDIVTIENSLDKVMKLRGVNFYWKDIEKYNDKLQMGFIAQEAEEIIPEVVDERGGQYSMSYASITALLVEGMKEQQKIIEKLRNENENFKVEIDEIKQMLNSSASRK